MQSVVLCCLILFVTAWAGAVPAFASPPGTLATLHAIHQLTKEQAGRGLPVAFEATVTYYSKSDVDLFVQDAGEAIYVEAKQNEDFAPGDRVLVQGKTAIASQRTSSATA